MANRKGQKASAAEPQRHSGLVNKTGMAVLMGAAGLGLVIGARFLAPAFVTLALVLMGVGVASAFFTVGPTYVGVCPHCGRKVVYKHAYGARSFPCRSCRGRIRLHKRAGGFEFDRA